MESELDVLHLQICAKHEAMCECGLCRPKTAALEMSCCDNLGIGFWENLACKFCFLYLNQQLVLSHICVLMPVSQPALNVY